MKPLLLLVDDDETYWELVRIAFQRLELSDRVELRRLDNGSAALEWLLDSSGGAENLSLLLVDQRMPGMDGVELVRRVRTLPGHARMPIGLMSGSTLPSQIAEAYGNGATFCLPKPTAFSELVELFDALTRFWFGAVLPPPGGGVAYSGAR